MLSPYHFLVFTVVNTSLCVCLSLWVLYAFNPLSPFGFIIVCCALTECTQISLFAFETHCVGVKLGVGRKASTPYHFKVSLFGVHSWLPYMAEIMALSSSIKHSKHKKLGVQPMRVHLARTIWCSSRKYFPGENILYF